jgi:hypothetical protein
MDASGDASEENEGGLRKWGMLGRRGYGGEMRDRYKRIDMVG